MECQQCQECQKNTATGWQKPYNGYDGHGHGWIKSSNFSLNNLHEYHTHDNR